MNANNVLQLGQATLSGSLPFPDIVGKLIAEGVEYYNVDYVALQMHFYSAGGGVVPVPLCFEGLPPVAEAFDAPALRLIGEAAQGSMRDALSITDQAIAFGHGKVEEQQVRQMLGYERDVARRSVVQSTRPWMSQPE